MLGNFRLSLGMFLFLAPTSIFRTCLSFVRRRSLLLTLFLALSVFVLSRISLVTFLMSFFSVLSALSISIFFVCPRSLLVLALCLSLLGLLLGLSLRMLLASFFGTSSLRHSPLLLLRLLLPRLCLLLRLQLFVLTVSVGLLLLGPSLVTLLFLLFWRLLLGLPLWVLRLSTSRMFSSPRLMVLVWVLWWRLVMLYNWLRVFLGVRFWFLCYPFQLGVVPLGRGALLFASCSASCVFFVEGVPSVAFDAQCSPGPANSL